MATRTRKGSQKVVSPVSDELYGTLRWTTEVPRNEVQSAFATLRDAKTQGSVSNADIRSLLS